MEERLEKALEFANYRQTLNNQFQKLKIRSEGLLIFSKNGGSFTITKELICFLELLERKKYKDFTILDDNNLPILIEDISSFLEEILQRYNSVTKDYYKEYQEIKKSRSVKSILDIKEL